MKTKSKLERIDDGILLPVSFTRRGATFQDAKCQVATWPNTRRLEFVFTTVRLPILGHQRVVLASLI